jgi:DNA-binding NarL/FixJ family response regulator
LTSTSNLLDAVTRLRPAVVLMDYEMPGEDTFAAVARLTQENGPSVPVAMLSAYCERAYIEKAVLSGATGYACKNDPPCSIVSVIRATANGEFALSPSAAAIVDSSA